MAHTTPTGVVGWAGAGGGVVVLCGLLGGQISQRGVTPGVVVGVTSALTVLALAVFASRREAMPVSRWEYAVGVVATSYWATVLACGAILGEADAANALFVLPPVSVAPLLVRLATGDAGDAHGLARRLAYQLHLVAGLVLATLGMLFVVTVYFIVIAPIPLGTAALHLGARRDYRRWRGDDVQPDPRLGFLR